jgi:hypothetical protein
MHGEKKMDLVVFLGAAFGSALDPSHTVVWALAGYLIRSYAVALLAAIGWRLLVQVVIVIPSMELTQSEWSSPYSTTAPIFAAVVVTSAAWAARRYRSRAISDTEISDSSQRIMEVSQPSVEEPKEWPIAVTQLSATNVDGRSDASKEAKNPDHLSVHIFWLFVTVGVSALSFGIGYSETRRETENLRRVNLDLTERYNSLTLKQRSEYEASSGKTSSGASIDKAVIDAINIELIAAANSLRSIPNHYTLDFDSLRDLASCRREAGRFQTFLTQFSLNQEAALRRLDSSKQRISQLSHLSQEN